jgi:hypothetical protein
MKIPSKLVFLLFLNIRFAQSLYPSFKSVLNKHNTQAQPAHSNAYFHVINEVRVCENYNLNDPNFLKRLKNFRKQVTKRQSQILENEKNQQIKLAQEKQKQEKIQFYRSSTAILGFSSVGVGTSRLHNNAKHWHS